MPEVIEAGAEHRCQRSKAGNVAAQVTTIGRMQAIGLHDHRHRVPAHVGAQALLDLDIAGSALFLVSGNRVDVSSGGRKRHFDAGLSSMVDQLFEQKVRALTAFSTDNSRQGVQPLAGFLSVEVLRVVGGCADEGIRLC